MSSGAEEKIQWRKEKSVCIQDEPLLDAVYRGEDTELEYELERRYLPTRYLGIKELEQLSKGEKREITQGYISAIDEAGELVMFRMRSTNQENKEGTLYRIARKFKIENSRAKIEEQLKFPPHDSDANDFSYLWERYVPKSEVISKTRYYIHHKLPNGHMCEIHYDIHHGRFEEFARIEVEFKGSTAEEDHQYVLDNGSATTLPNWVGKDVSEDKRYGGSTLAKLGAPTEVLEAQKYMRPNA